MVQENFETPGAFSFLVLPCPAFFRSGCCDGFKLRNRFIFVDIRKISAYDPAELRSAVEPAKNTAPVTRGKFPI
jgi:hypothetical protein